MVVDVLVLAAGLAATQGLWAQEPVEDLLEKARQAYASGQTAEAVLLAGKAIDADPEDPRCYFVRASLHEALRQHEKAIADYGQVIRLRPDLADVYNRRGYERFRMGRMEECLADFDKAIELDPSMHPHHWQRGIALYYAGRYEDGRKQFELHQTVNSDDVENAVWHYLCAARVTSPQAAREAILPISGDVRVPMMQIYALFRGRGSVHHVLKAARRGSPGGAELNQRLFYAHLYIGLYYESLGNALAAREHILRAAEQNSVPHYMGDVARVHARLFEKAAR